MISRNARRFFYKYAWWVAGALLLISLAGCTPTEDIHIGLGGRPRIAQQDAEGWHVELPLRVENPNRKHLTLSKAELDVWLQGSKLGSIRLSEKVQVSKRSTEEVVLPVVLKFRSPADELRMIVTGLRHGIEGFEVMGNAHVGYGGLTKRVEIHRQPLTSLLRQLGAGTISPRGNGTTEGAND